MTTGMVHDQNLEKHIEKQMGCMTGFLQIFDRHQIITGKRIYSAKRLPSSAATDSSTETEELTGSPAISGELNKHQPRSAAPSFDRMKQSPPSKPQSPKPETTSTADTQAKTPLTLPVFEFKERTGSSWKFSREAPRLSLDSRAVVDAKGSLHPREIRTNSAVLPTNRGDNRGDGAENDGEKQRGSTGSVIARLMGLNPLSGSDPEPVKAAELRRSASESRVNGDLFQYRFFDRNNFQLKQLKQRSNSHCNISSNVVRDSAAGIDNRISNSNPAKPKEFVVRNGRTEPAKASLRGIGQKKSFFDSADFFPEPKHAVSIYGEIEKRLKLRGIDEHSKDLETLKQILEALQLKGLLHSKKPTAQTNQRNFVFDGSLSGNQSPIVVMKPARLNRPGRAGSESPPSSFRSSPRGRCNLSLANETLPTMSPRRDRPEIDRNSRNQSRARGSSSTTRSESNVQCPNWRRHVNNEAQRKLNDSYDQRRISPVNSPKISPRRYVSDQQVTNRSPRMRKPASEIYHKEEKVLVSAEDESSTISGSSISTSSQTDTERCKWEEYKEGRHLLERCEKLLHSIAEITATELQPSPVSVLDSSFYKDESSSPSPVTKRCIQYIDQRAESEYDIWSAALSSIEAKSDETLEDCDFVYVSEILRASNYLPEDCDVFELLEKQQYLKGKEMSKASTLQRRLIFDTVTEILNRNRQLPPWKATSWATSGVVQTSLLQRIWSEFRRIRDTDESEELFEVICGVLKKDLAVDGINGWEEYPIEMGEMVLDMERLIFKDLIGETIRDLAALAGQCKKVSALRKKLVF